MNFNIIIYAYLVLQLRIRDKPICVFFSNQNGLVHAHDGGGTL